MKAEKNYLVEHILGKVNASPFMFLVDYTGLTVDKFAELRKRLRGVGAELRVYKNTLVKQAANRAKYPAEVAAALKGQTAVVTGDKDVCAAAKTMKNFAAEFEKPKMKGGVLDGKYLDANGIKTLADLPSMDALRAQLLGLLTTPGSSLARLLNEPAASLARVLNAKATAEQS